MDIEDEDFDCLKCYDEGVIPSPDGNSHVICQSCNKRLPNDFLQEAMTDVYQYLLNNSEPLDIDISEEDLWDLYED